MRIAFVTAGAAGMYCGTCMQDNTLAAALQEQGHDIALIPTYTPTRTDEADVSIDRVFYGAISVYLEQKSALFRHTPWLVDRLLNAPRLLDWAARMGSSTDARDLGALTLSVLEGENGKQRKELDRLVAWLYDDFRPEVVHFSNSMLLGMAGRVREALEVPVVCSLQGEDIFLDDLVAPYRDRVMETLRKTAKIADAFVVHSRYYREFMAGYLDVPEDRIRAIELGLNLDGHGGPLPERGDRPFVVGYLARVCPEKGLHLLVSAFRRLAERAGPGNTRLRIAGYLGARDRAYLDGILGQVADWGLQEVVEHVGEVDRAGKIAFLQSLDVLSVPTVYREPKGLYVLESLANGIPVAQPGHGAFPEMIEATGGGILVAPDSDEALADGLHQLMLDPDRRRALGEKGRRAVHERYTAERTARETVEMYRGLVEAGSRG